MGKKQQPTEPDRTVEEATEVPPEPEVDAEPDRHLWFKVLDTNGDRPGVRSGPTMCSMVPSWRLPRTTLPSLQSHLLVFGGSSDQAYGTGTASSKAYPGALSVLDLSTASWWCPPVKGPDHAACGRTGHSMTMVLPPKPASQPPVEEGEGVDGNGEGGEDGGGGGASTPPLPKLRVFVYGGVTHDQHQRKELGDLRVLEITDCSEGGGDGDVSFEWLSPEALAPAEQRAESPDQPAAKDPKAKGGKKDAKAAKESNPLESMKIVEGGGVRVWHSSFYCPKTNLFGLLGGFRDGKRITEDEFVVFHPHQFKWTSHETPYGAAAEGTGIAYHNNIVVKSHLFVFGGTDGKGESPHLQMLDLSTFTWSKPHLKGPKLSSVWACATAVTEPVTIQDEADGDEEPAAEGSDAGDCIIYVYGGLPQSQDQPQCQPLRYLDISGRDFSTIADPPAGEEGPSPLYWGQITSGVIVDADDENKKPSELEDFAPPEPDEDREELSSVQLTFKQNPAIAPINNKLVIFGGKSTSAADDVTFHDEVVSIDFDYMPPEWLTFGECRYANGDYYKGLWSHSKREGEGTCEYGNGDKYEGTWVNDKREGKGACVYNDGSKYEGDWKDDLRDGDGVHVSANGDKYTGQWNRDLRHGHGKVEYATGDRFKNSWKTGDTGEGFLLTYEGPYENDFESGSGKGVFANGDVFNGSWKGGLRHGSGTCEYSNGDFYEGEWKAGKRHGKGVHTTRNGERYDGDWVNDKRNGRGEAHYSNGDVYIGRWIGGVRSGPGVCSFGTEVRRVAGVSNTQASIKKEYNGEWSGDRPHGKGQCSYVNGDTFEGQWQEGNRSGHGVCTYVNAEKYTGEWVKDLRDTTATPGQSKSIFVMSDGSVHEGQWKAGERHGEGKISYPDGSTYDGQWKLDRCSGYAVQQNSNGDVYEGTFDDGVRNGVGKMTYQNGDVYEGTWRENKRVTWSDAKANYRDCGICIYANGDRYEGAWRNDLREGQGTIVYANGDKYEGPWKGDQPHGTGKFTTVDGSVYDGDFVKGERQTRGK